MICPCKDCEFRHIGCHAECAPFKEWQEAMSLDRKERINRDLATAYSIRQIQKNKRKRGIK